MHGSPKPHSTPARSKRSVPPWNGFRTTISVSCSLTNTVFFRPYFCFFPFLWPYLYRCEEVAVARTEPQRVRYEAVRFTTRRRASLYLSYIWVTYDLPEGETTVYRPPVVCYTRWEYDCSSDIDVQLNDSRIRPTCGTPLTGLTCAIRSIGTSVSPLEIEQDLAATIPIPGVTSFETVGLTDYKTKVLKSYSPLLEGQHVRPYTNSFPIIAQFSEDLPAAGLHYFQVEYRRTHSPRTTGATMNQLIDPTDPNSGWKTLDSGELGRRYVWQEGFDFKYSSYHLGPFTVGGEEAYRIPPFDPFLPRY